MKKLILLLAVVFSASLLQAQVEQGKVLLGGSTNFTFSSTTIKATFDGEELGEMKMSTINFAPEVGYFLMDGLAIGVILDYSSAKAKYSDESDWSDPSTSIGIGAFGKYYLSSGNFKPFVKGMLGFMTQSEGHEDDDKSSGLAFGGALGAAYFLTENVAFEFGLGYTVSNMKNKAVEEYILKASDLSFKVGIAVTF
jgi:outer membrane protein